MISPDAQILHSRDLDLRFRCYLTHSSVLVKSCQRAEIFCWNVGCIFGANQGVSVRGVPDDDDPGCGLCYAVEDLTLLAEDGSIGLQKICALHSRPSRSCPHQDGIVSVLEGHLRISCRYDLLK